jgi:ssDNA-binding Zn-finger/Zn-ribbon topoisomerase 1
MILFKQCPRCGGDVDATYGDDAFCVQCSHRPTLAYPGPRVVDAVPAAAAGPTTTGPPNGVLGGRAPCPRCGRVDLLELEKLRVRDNTCYRCRACGHIFSPAAAGDAPRHRSGAL